MHLNESDLRHSDKSYLRSLGAAELLGVSLRILAELTEARDRLNQTPANGSRPSSSRAAWERAAGYEEAGAEEAAAALSEALDEMAAEAEVRAAPPPTEQQKKSRQAGRQKGAKGHGRKVTLAVTGEQVHRAARCAACDQRWPPPRHLRRARGGMGWM